MESKSSSSSLRFIGHQRLFTAVRSGDMESIRRLIEEEEEESLGDLMALQNEAGETALYIAAENNRVDVFDYLVGLCEQNNNNKHPVLLRTNSDLDPFHSASKRGYLGIVKTLLSKWPELCEICDSSNTSPLYSAAVQGHLEVVNSILDTDPNSMRIVRKNGKTALHTAGRYGLLQIVRAFIERDAGIVSVKDKKGQTALHMAAKGQDTAVIEELLHADHSILNERDKKGNTAIHIATRKCRPQVQIG